MATNSVDVLDKLRNLKIPSNVNYALSVQAGGNLVAPYAAYQEIHMYVGNEKALEYFQKQMNLENAEQGANLILMLPILLLPSFWLDSSDNHLFFQKIELLYDKELNKQ